MYFDNNSHLIITILNCNFILVSFWLIYNNGLISLKIYFVNINHNIKDQLSFYKSTFNNYYIY